MEIETKARGDRKMILKKPGYAIMHLLLGNCLINNNFTMHFMYDSVHYNLAQNRLTYNGMQKKTGIDSSS